jgi:hypothetical protein
VGPFWLAGHVNSRGAALPHLVQQTLALTALAVVFCGCIRAQGNYEIQVYGSDTVAPDRAMVELHSNFTFEGFKTAEDGVWPDEHQLHETLEITQGWTDWFETGSTFSPVMALIKDTSGLGTTSALVCVFPMAGTGPLA